MADLSFLAIAEPKPFDSLLSLKGKTAIVTGGSKGIGRQVVKRFIEAGAQVVTTARGKDALEKAAKELGAAAFCADLSSLADCQKTAAFTVEKFGGLDILVNNAASYPFSPGLDMTEETWDEAFDTDAKGAFFMAQYAAKAMIKAGKGGRIINFLSTAALNPTSPLIAYGAAKQALWYVTQTLAQELAPHKILVNAVTPGATMTQERINAFGSGNLAELGQKIPDSFKGLSNQIGELFPQMLKKAAPLGRTGYPDDLAKAVLFLASDMAEYISGVNITVDGAQHLQNPMFSQIPAGIFDSGSEPEDGQDDNGAPAGELDKGLEGKWKAKLNTPLGEQEIILDYRVEGNALTGAITIMGNEVKVEDGKATAEGFSHVCKIKAGLMSAKGKVSGRLEGGKILGNIKGPMGNMPFTGSRI